MTDRTIIDQHILNSIIKRKSPELMAQVDDLVSKRLVPGTFLLTQAGILEFCDFTFHPTRFVAGLHPAPHIDLGWIKEELKKDLQIFNGQLEDKPISFGVGDYLQIAKARLAQERAYRLSQLGSELTADIASFYEGISAYLESLQFETISEYWAIRIMCSDAFVHRFVGQLKEFLLDTLTYCLKRDVPCSRVVALYAQSFVRGDIPKFRVDEEHLDEDAVWHLVFGKSTPPDIHRICFITKELSFNQTVRTFTLVVHALERLSLLPATDRLDKGSGELIILNENAPPGRLYITDLLENYRQRYPAAEHANVGKLG